MSNKKLQINDDGSERRKTITQINLKSQYTILVEEEEDF